MLAPTRFCRQIIFKETATAIKAGGDALTDGATVKDIKTNTYKFTVRTVLDTT